MAVQAWRALVTCSGSQTSLGLEAGLDLGLCTSRTPVLSWEGWPLLQGRGPGHLNHGVNKLNAPPELETCLKALRPQGQIWKISSNKAFSFKNMFVSLWPFCSDFSQSVPFPLLSSHQCKGSETLRSSKRRLEKLHPSRP